MYIWNTCMKDVWPNLGLILWQDDKNKLYIQEKT